MCLDRVSIAGFVKKSKKKHTRAKAECVCDLACKPGSVLTAIYLAPGLLPGSSHLLGTAGQACCPTHGVAPDRVYIIKPMSPWAGCALTAPFHPYLVDAGPTGRYLSVALVLGLPPAGVTRYPCPVEPGLSSSGPFRIPSAAVRPGRCDIVLDISPNVKHLAKSFLSGYTRKQNNGS